MNARQTAAPLSPEELERYARHIVLPEIGGAGQQKLKRARASVIGAGVLARRRCNIWRQPASAR